jgi:HD-GYP domain-containing protein (c-di-GMP phosphodiesterase class II)
MHDSTMLSIVSGSIEIGPVPFNIYRSDDLGSPVLFCRAGYEITMERKRALGETGRSFFVPAKEMTVYLDYAADRIEDIVTNPAIPVNDKLLLVKSIGSRMVDRILKDQKSGLDYRRAGAFVNSYITVIVNNPDLRAELFAIASRGRYLLSRSFNVCTLCLLIGERIYGRDRAHLSLLGAGGLMLDVGMTRVDEQIVEKQEKLDGEELDRIRRHPEFSFQILKEKNFPAPVLQMALCHHERCDGSGYPDGIGADRIHPYALIAAVADTYDAITSDKPYGSGESPVAALGEMAAAPGRYDYLVFSALLKVVLGDDKLIEHFRKTHGLAPASRSGRFD